MTALRDYELSIAVSADPLRYSGNKGDKDRVAPGTYAIVAPGRNPGRVFTGSGYVSNSETLFAYGVMHVLDDIILDELEEISGDGDNFRLNVTVRNSGTEKYLDEHVVKWLRQAELKGDGNRPNSFSTWKRIYALSNLGKIALNKAETTDRKRLLDALQVISKSECSKLDRPDRSQQEAIISSGELPFAHP